MSCRICKTPWLHDGQNVCDSCVKDYQATVEKLRVAVEALRLITRYNCYNSPVDTAQVALKQIGWEEEK